MKINEALNRRSNITPIARMGAPVRSAASRAADVIQTPDSIVGLLGSAGNWTSGLTSALKSGLGFYGAMQDARNQQAYNDYLAEQAAQERQDKLAQQNAEMDYKNRYLEQQATLAGNQLQAQKDLENARFEHQKALAELQRNAATSAENSKKQEELEKANLELRRRGIDPDLYGVDADYTAAINDAIKKQAVQDQINAATVELGKSGKVGMDKVGQSLATGKPLTFGENSWLSNMFGINKFGIGSKPQAAPAPSLVDITKAYQAQLAQQKAQPQQNYNYTNVSNEDLLKGL